MNFSLRARLVLGVIALVTVALVVAGAATYTALQSFLISQLDTGLQTNIHPAFQTWSDVNSGHYRGPGGADFPPGTVLALYSPDGVQIDALVHFAPSGTPQLPHTLPTGTEQAPAILSVSGTGAFTAYRVAVAPLDEAQGNTFVLAEPLTGVNSTLGHLLLLEGIVGAGVLVATAFIALAIVQLSLRPLGRMEETAAAIAAGDLSRRVDAASQRTEIGRLGLALNAMLAQIEAAFGERTRSEQRLREFMAAASHELRTPLTSIRGYSEMLRRGAEASPEDSAQARRRIEEESVRMTGLVDDMLLLARLDSGRPLELGRVDLARLASDAASDARAVAREREVGLDVPEHVWLSGDEARLRQVVGNLVRNAIVHTPAKTPVEIAVHTSNGHAALDVIDHGRGLDAEEAARVFEPFYRADAGRSRDRGGAGLGLSIVAAVVEAHGGTVRALPTTGGGATFRVELPLAAADPQPSEPAL